MSLPGFGQVKWRNSGLGLRFFGVDGRALLLLALLMYHPRWWTLGLFFVGIGVLVVLERMGYTIPNALRRFRILMVGTRRPAVTLTRAGRSDR